MSISQYTNEQQDYCRDSTHCLLLKYQDNFNGIQDELFKNDFYNQEELETQEVHNLEFLTDENLNPTINNGQNNKNVQRIKYKKIQKYQMKNKRNKGVL